MRICHRHKGPVGSAHVSLTWLFMVYVMIQCISVILEQSTSGLHLRFLKSARNDDNDVNDDDINDDDVDRIYQAFSRPLS